MLENQRRRRRFPFALLLALIPVIVLESRKPYHDRHDVRLVSRTSPATDEFFFQTNPGRGLCGRLTVASKMLSSSTAAAHFECRKTPGCTHVTRNAKTRETFLCSGFVDLIDKNTMSDWVYSVRTTCSPWGKFLYGSLSEDLKESLCEKQFLDSCPAWTFPVREPWHKSPSECAHCPPKGCSVPRSLRHVDTLAKPLGDFAMSFGKDMRAMNPSLYKLDGQFYVVFRITNQTRCKPLSPVTSLDETKRTYVSHVGHVELEPSTMAVREDTFQILAYDDDLLAHTVEYGNHEDLPFRGVEDCRAVVISGETFMLCSKYTKFTEFTRKTPRRPSTRSIEERNKDSTRRETRLEVQGERERIFDFDTEEIETSRVALLRLDRDHMRFTGGVQFDVRFVDKDNKLLSDPDLYKIMQKNWMLVPTENLRLLTFIVNTFPHVLAACEVSNATCTVRAIPHSNGSSPLLSSNQMLQQWRGGSMLLRTRHGLLSVVHSRKYISSVAMYSHALALFSNDFPHHLLSISEPFSLPRSRNLDTQEQDIQFASGLEYDEENETLFISYGLADCSAELAVLRAPFETLRWHKVVKERMQGTSQRVSRRTSPMSQSRTSSQKSTSSADLQKSNSLVRIAGPITSTFSLAGVNREFALAVVASGMDLTLRNSHWGDAVDVLYENARFGHLHRFLEKRLVDAARPAAVTIYNNWPVQLFPPLRGRWVWNLAWEFQAIPLSWREVMITEDVTVWTPSTFTMESLLRAGVPARKVKYVPHAVEADDICALPDKRTSIFQLKEGVVDDALRHCHSSGADFIYLYHGAALWRKGLDVLLRAFSSKQQGLANTCLIVHVSYGDDEVYEIVRQHMESAGVDGQTLVVLADTLDKDDLAKLFRSVDAIVHPSRAEGFGLVAAQALACNKTLIATAEGATRDFAKSDTAFLVEGQFVECNKPPSSAIGLFNMEVTSKPLWYEPSKKSLVDAMVEARYNGTEREKRRSAGYKLVSTRFSRKNLHRRVKEELLELQGLDYGRKEIVSSREMKSRER